MKIESEMEISDTEANDMLQNPDNPDVVSVHSHLNRLHVTMFVKVMQHLIQN